eukprot:1545680-Amphidinium_carterae.4
MAGQTPPGMGKNRSHACRQRDVLPLPSNLFEVPGLRKSELSRSVQQRVLRKQRIAGMSREVALEIHGGRSSLWSVGSTVSAAQLHVRDHIVTCTQAMGSPPDDLTSAKALSALSAKASTYHQDAGVLAPLNVELLSLPVVGGRPVDISIAGGEAGRLIIISGCYQKLLHASSEFRTGLGKAVYGDHFWTLA